MRSEKFTWKPGEFTYEPPDAAEIEQESREARAVAARGTSGHEVRFMDVAGEVQVEQRAGEATARVVAMRGQVGAPVLYAALRQFGQLRLAESVGDAEARLVAAGLAERSGDVLARIVQPR